MYAQAPSSASGAASRMPPYTMPHLGTATAGSRPLAQPQPQQHQQQQQNQKATLQAATAAATLHSGTQAVQWEWRAGRDRWQPFPAATCVKLEEAAGRQLSGASGGAGHVDVGGGRAVNLLTMKQYVIAETWRTRDVRRQQQ